MNTFTSPRLPPHALGGLVARYESHLQAEGKSWRLRKVLTDTVQGFLSWLTPQGPTAPAIEALCDEAGAWTTREHFLRVSCADRDQRHELRAHLNDFLRFWQAMGGFRR